MDYDEAINETFSESEDVLENDNEVIDGDDDKDDEKADVDKGDKSNQEKDKGTKGEEGSEGDDESGGDGEGDEKSQKLKKPSIKNRLRKRIEDQSDEIAQLRSELNDFRRKDEERQIKEPELPPMPNRTQFRNPREFDFAMGRWQATVENLKKNHETQKESIKQGRIDKEKGEYLNRINRGMTAYDHDDFTDKVGRLTMEPTQAMHDTFCRIDNPADVLYFLGDHSDIAKKVFSLDYQSQMIELAAISTKLKAVLNQKRMKSNASKPTKKVESGKGGRGTPMLENMKISDFKKMLEKKK